MAVGLDTGVPWVMCKEDDAPDPLVSHLILIIDKSLVSLVSLSLGSDFKNIRIDFFLPYTFI